VTHVHRHNVYKLAHKQNVRNVFISNDEQNVIDSNVGLEYIHVRFKVFIPLTFFMRVICIFGYGSLLYERNIFLHGKKGYSCFEDIFSFNMEILK